MRISVVVVVAVVKESATGSLPVRSTILGDTRLCQHKPWK